MRIVLWSLALLFFSACQSGQEEPSTKPQESSEKPELREYSELAGMMTSIHAYHGLLKDSVLAGASSLPSIPIDLKRLHNADATDPRELDGDYHELASTFIDQLDSLQKAGISDRVSLYNSSVKTCVECHQTRCPGPIPRIKKLRIKESVGGI